MNTKHTPGPWKYQKGGGPYHHFHIQTEDMSHMDTYIGEIGGGRQSFDVIEANARLIAAAPELLEALEFLLLAIGTDDNKEWLDAVGNAQAAIAKATGANI